MNNSYKQEIHYCFFKVHPSIHKELSFHPFEEIFASSSMIMCPMSQYGLSGCRTIITKLSLAFVAFDMFTMIILQINFHTNGTTSQPLIYKHHHHFVPFVFTRTFPMFQLAAFKTSPCLTFITLKIVNTLLSATRIVFKQFAH